MARYAARAAQCHIGLARRLARDEGARIRRRDTVKLANRIHTTADAVAAAADLTSIADEESGAAGAERDARERARLLETLGADPAARTQPPAVRARLAALEKEQKTRATRFARDVVDRSLIDLVSIYRDALMLHVQAPVELVNDDLRPEVETLARRLGPVELLAAMDAITTARQRIDANVPPLLALEAMAVGLKVGPS